MKGILNEYRATDLQRNCPTGDCQRRNGICGLCDPCRELYDKAVRVKTGAVGQVSRALKSGKLVRPDHCALCKTPCLPNGHHDDYSKPLDVIWCCDSCHGKRHAEFNLISRAEVRAEIAAAKAASAVRKAARIAAKAA